MACGYLGCGTVANKVAWAATALLLLVGAILLGVGLSKAVPCSRTLVECRQQQQAPRAGEGGGAQGQCSNAYRSCARPHLAVAAVGLLVAVAGLMVVCCMCCCSKPPAPKAPQMPYAQPYGHNVSGGAVQMASPQHGTYGAGPPVPAPYPGAYAAAPAQQGAYTYSPYAAQQQHMVQGGAAVHGQPSGYRL